MVYNIYQCLTVAHAVSSTNIVVQNIGGIVILGVLSSDFLVCLINSGEFWKKHLRLYLISKEKT